jgi:hypothetical protein
MSDLFSLNYKDLLKGLIMAVLTPVLVIIQQSVEIGELTFNWKQIVVASIAGAVAYLIKNFFTAPNLNYPTSKEGEGAVIPTKGFKQSNNDKP